VVERPALELLNVSKKYGDRNAVVDASVVARPGRIHGLLGPNGAGKTTMLRIALGLVRLDAGTVRVLESKMASMPNGIPEGLAGFVEAPAFYPYLTGRQNLRHLG